MKRCFGCKKKKFLFLFKKDSSKYQLKSSFGRCVLCRVCSIKRAFEKGGYLQRVDKKFVSIKANKWEIIKHFLK
jgi:hypothetical protein